MDNREEWEAKGESIVKEMVEKWCMTGNRIFEEEEEDCENEHDAAGGPALV